MGVLWDWIMGKRKKNQNTFCYCPDCRNELCGSNSLVRDENGVVTYKCSNCGKVTQWLFDTPVPILI